MTLKGGGRYGHRNTQETDRHDRCGHDLDRAGAWYGDRSGLQPERHAAATCGVPRQEEAAYETTGRVNITLPAGAVPLKFNFESRVTSNDPLQAGSFDVDQEDPTKVRLGQAYLRDARFVRLVLVYSAGPDKPEQTVPCGTAPKGSWFRVTFPS